MAHCTNCIPKREFSGQKVPRRESSSLNRTHLQNRVSAQWAAAGAAWGSFGLGVPTIQKVERHQEALARPRTCDNLTTMMEHCALAECRRVPSARGHSAAAQLRGLPPGRWAGLPGGGPACAAARPRCWAPPGTHRQCRRRGPPAAAPCTSSAPAPRLCQLRHMMQRWVGY